MKIRFTKMHGLGNDFVVIDAINQKVALSPERIRHLADRHFGIGFDQLLLVEPARLNDADFGYSIFNADGSEVGQCGNGARCFARFVREQRLCDKDEIRVDTHAGRLILRIEANGNITVNMGIPRHQPRAIPMTAKAEAKDYTVRVDGIELHFGAVSLGNPHAVLQVNEIAAAPVGTLGPLLENHSLFPQRANIGFMEIVDRHRLRLRVHERGAAETLACGSGACAAVVVAIEQDLVSSPVTVSLPGGELSISWQGRGQPVFMTGPAVSVFEGTIDL